MMPLVGAIFLASLLGSFHCAGMCGAFLAIAVNDASNPRRHAAMQSAYHLGRLISYLSLGIAAGVAGHLVNLGGALAGVRSAATLFAGATIIVFACITLSRTLGLHLPRVAAPAVISRITVPVYRLAMTRPPFWRAAIIGLSTTLLPCGWLYAFVVTAAGTASPASAALVMFVFWLGTLPLMVSFGAGVRALSGPLQRRMPLAMCCVLLMAGAYTLFGRRGLIPSRWAAPWNIASGFPSPEPLRVVMSLQTTDILAAPFVSNLRALRQSRAGWFA